VNIINSGIEYIVIGINEERCTDEMKSLNRKVFARQFETLIHLFPAVKQGLLQE
jgi:hypothetical protein